MEYRQRRLVAAAVLAVSLIIVAYLVFFSPSETQIATPTLTTSDSGSPQSTGQLIWTPLPSKPETDEKRTAEAAAAQSELTPELADLGSSPDDANRVMAPIPDWMSRIQSMPTNAACPDDMLREVPVATAQELKAALESARPGDHITLAEGTYIGNFDLAASGEDHKPIWICGPRTAIIDGGGLANPYGLRITGSHVGAWGITVSNAQTGIVVDGGDYAQIDNVEVRTTGEEAIRFRANATDGVVQDSDVHHTGLSRENRGEGISVGTAISDWPSATIDSADKSDRVRISRNRIWDTTAEAIDLKEGTSGGMVDFNSLDGAGMISADSWIDIRGNQNVIRNNVGVTSPGDGFQTHTIAEVSSGSENQFIGNTAQVDSPGYGFYIQDPETTHNLLSCTNMVSKAASGFANVDCADQT